MATQAQPSRWRRFRVIFRRCRITVWSIILLGILGLLYLNMIGFPGFIKKPLLEKLHAHGLDLRFSRLRWRPFYGMVADNVTIEGTNSEWGPQFRVREVQIGMDYAALFKRQFQVDSLTLRRGQLDWPVANSNEPPRDLSIDNIETELQLLTDGVWELDNLQAQFGGAQIHLSGALTNASAILDWKLFQRGQPKKTADLQSRLYRLADTLEQIHLTPKPDLRLDIRGDARNVENITVRLLIQAPSADTPWGTLSNAFCKILLAPPPKNQLSRAEIKLHAQSSVTKWAGATNLTLTGHLFSAEGDSNLVRAEFDLAADSAQVGSNHLEQIHCTANLLHSLTNIIPLSGHSELQACNAVTTWGEVKQVHINAVLQPTTNRPSPDPSWAWWGKLAPYPIDVDSELTGVHSPKLEADEIVCSSEWRGPELNIKKLTATLYGGKLEANAKLNVVTRNVSFEATSDVDGQKLAPLLTPQAQNWLANYSWNNPPHVKATGSLVLPVSVWTNRHPDWRGETRPTLRLDGEFHVVDGAFRGVHALTADSHFTYSNMCWRLPDLLATRPEGNLNVFDESNDRTQDYHFRFASTIDPQALRPLIPTNQQRGFDLVTITQPPVVEGELWGRWHDHELIHGHARVTATNFAVRGQSFDSLQTQVDYTNQTLTLINPIARRAGTQVLSASCMSYTFGERRILVTNGFSTAEPMAMARAIGPQIEHNISPYQFLRPPTVHADGAIPIRSERDADLHFAVDGGPFRWWKLGAPHVSGKIDWVGNRLSLKEMKGDFYLGKATGNADFNFEKDTRSADFRFTLVATDASLNLLAKDLTDGKSNKLEGLLTGRVEITNANTVNWETWGGAGRVNLRDGLIWDIPIFGIFSPALDTIMPGLGSSRAREGSATFVVTNGVVFSDNLKVETLMARLRYWGTVNLKGIVDARMEAQLFRNAWVVGPVLSLALWPVSKTFEYQITGSIHKPKSDPVYLPKVLFFPLHPVETIKDMIPEDTNSVANPIYPPVSSPHPPGKP